MTLTNVSEAAARRGRGAAAGVAGCCRERPTPPTRSFECRGCRGGQPQPGKLTVQVHRFARNSLERDEHAHRGGILLPGQLRRDGHGCSRKRQSSAKPASRCAPATHASAGLPRGRPRLSAGLRCLGRDRTAARRRRQSRSADSERRGKRLVAARRSGAPSAPGSTRHGGPGRGKRGASAAPQLLEGQRPARRPSPSSQTAGFRHNGPASCLASWRP